VVGRHALRNATRAPSATKQLTLASLMLCPATAAILPSNLPMLALEKGLHRHGRFG
jgi:hypothetical protein